MEHYGWTVMATTAAATAAGLCYLYLNPYRIADWFNGFLAWRVGWRRRCVDLGDGCVMWYSERGQPHPEKPTVLLVHGFCASIHSWNLTVLNMSTKHHMVAMDLPGHGNSSYNFKTDVSLDGIIARLHQFVEVTDLASRQLHLVGISMGGLIAGCYAAKYSANVSKISLVCPAMRTPELSEAGRDTAEGKENPMSDMSVQGLRDTLKLMLNQDPSIPFPLLYAFADVRRRHHKYYMMLFDCMTNVLLQEDEHYLCKSAKHIRASTQIIWGDADKVVDISGAAFLEKHLPNCQRMDILPAAPHAVDMAMPKRLAAVLEAFIDADIPQRTTAGT